MTKETKQAFIGTILAIVVILTFPFLVYGMTGKFTLNVNKAFDEMEEKEDRAEYEMVKEYCDFDVVQTRYGWDCHRPCMKHSLDDKNCVPKGCVDTGFLSMECDLYVCEGFGDVQPQCLSYYRGSKEDYCKEYPDDKMYCYDGSGVLP